MSTACRRFSAHELLTLVKMSLSYTITAHGFPDRRPNHSGGSYCLWSTHTGSALSTESLWPRTLAKVEGLAMVQLPNDSLRRVELHWYEAHGKGKRDIKIKRYLDG